MLQCNSRLERPFRKLAAEDFWKNRRHVLRVKKNTKDNSDQCSVAKSRPGKGQGCVTLCPGHVGAQRNVQGTTSLLTIRSLIASIRVAGSQLEIFYVAGDAGTPARWVTRLHVFRGNRALNNLLHKLLAVPRGVSEQTCGD